MFFQFNPDNNFLKNNGIFGLPVSPDSAMLHIIPVHWDVTTSYRDGTAYGPDAIREASYQIDLFDPVLPGEWKKGIHMGHCDDWLSDMNSFERRKAKTVIDFIETHDEELPERLRRALIEINDSCEQMNGYVSAKVRQCLAEGRIPAVLGGEHSVSYGAVSELLKDFPQMGMLQFDAHADLRNGYLGFDWSHASVMRNIASKLPQKVKIVQVGVRDLCHDEVAFAENPENQISTFYMRDLHDRMFNGSGWKKISEHIVSMLPEQVYISFDIDALSPELCPHTGTPVPAGMSYEQAIYLIAAVVKSGRKIMGFDLVEVAPDPDNQWDETVGARLLYQLCIHALASHQ